MKQMSNAVIVTELVGAAFGLLSYARSRAIDLGQSEVSLLASMEKLSPGVSETLRRLCPPARIKPSRDSKRQSRRVAQVNPIKRKAVDGR